MQITLNIYERGFEGVREGKPFEPQVWHRSEFLEKNFIRFFNSGFMVENLFVEVPSIKGAPDSFNFDFNGELITVKTSLSC